MRWQFSDHFSHAGGAAATRGCPAERAGNVVAPRRPRGGMERFALPEDHSTHEVLKAVFHHYCRFGRTSASGKSEQRLDNVNWAKLCNQTPDLYTKYFTKSDTDIIFSHAVAHGERRLDYNHFLEALYQMALRKYPECDPMTAFANLLAEHVLGLVAEEGHARGTVDRILGDLTRPAPAAAA